MSSNPSEGSDTGKRKYAGKAVAVASGIHRRQEKKIQEKSVLGEGKSPPFSSKEGGKVSRHECGSFLGKGKKRKNLLLQGLPRERRTSRLRLA